MNKTEGVFQERVELEKRPSVFRRIWTFLSTGWTAKKLFWWFLAIALVRIVVIPFLRGLG